MTLLNPKFNYKSFKRQEKNGKRLYACPDGNAVPSVTTILDKTKPEEARKALAEWKKRVGEQKAQQITTEAASRGTRMHTYLEKYILGEEIPENVSNPYAQQSLTMAKTVITEGFPKINEIWGAEVPVYFPGLYAGTTDCVGIHEDSESILDFKQANKPKKLEWISDYFLQLTAYALAHNEVYNTKIQKGVVLMCVRPQESADGLTGTPLYQEFILEEKDFDYWTEEWCKRVEQYYKIA